jgi:sporulation protein YlmC with PRC-barrel domain
METVADRSSFVKSNEVIGVDVINPQNENLGSIYEIVLDKSQGTVAYAVMESGSFLGLGGKFIALPWKTLRYHPESAAFVINHSKDQIKNSPGFDQDDWPKQGKYAYWDEVSTYYADL